MEIGHLQAYKKRAPTSMSREKLYITPFCCLMLSDVMLRKLLRTLS